MNLIERYIHGIELMLEKNGTLMYDHQLKRRTLEIQLQTINIKGQHVAYLLGAYPVAEKFEPELRAFNIAMDLYITRECIKKNHRRLVHFNDFQYPDTFQCISLVQFLPADRNFQYYRMIVYQRSGDTAKMMEDFRFFAEMAYIFTQKTRYQVSTITVVYGSLHCKVMS